MDKIPLMPLVDLLVQKIEIGGHDLIEWEAWVQKELMSVGSELSAKFSNLQVLEVVIICLILHSSINQMIRTL